MATATVRDLRTQFPRVRRMLEEDGEVVVTLRGRPVLVLRPVPAASERTPARVDYYARLRRRMPKPMSQAARRALDEANRGER